MSIKSNKFFSFFTLALIGMSEVEEYREVERDGVVNDDDRYLPGIHVSEESEALQRVRQDRDVLSHSVRGLRGNPEVEEWLDKMGGIRRLDEALMGKDRLRSYISDLRLLRDQLGYTPSPVGEPVFVETDSATSNSGYAVEAHRTLKNREHHGEVDFDDEENTTPSWALSEYDFNMKQTQDGAPWWWSKISLGKYNPQIVGKVQKLAKGFIGPANKVLPKLDLVQVETGGAMWRNDLRISDKPGGFPFKSVDNLMPAHMVDEHPMVKEFLDRFYNNPFSLKWFKNGTGSYERHAVAMMIPNGPMEGKYMWATLSTKSSKAYDWWMENDGKAEELKYARALYYKDWVIVYRKPVRTWNLIEVVGYKESTTGHGLMEMSRKKMDWRVWGRTKTRLVKDGAKDAYFGKPWEDYVARGRANDKPRQQSPEAAWNSL